MNRLCPAVLALLTLVQWYLEKGFDSRGCYTSARTPAGSGYLCLHLYCTLQIRAAERIQKDKTQHHFSCVSRLN